MAGKNLQLFNDFANSTPDLILGGKRAIINEAQKHSWILNRTLQGRSTKEIFSQGNEAKVELMFDENSTAEWYKPNSTFTWTNPQVLSEVKVPLRYLADHMSWTAQEIESNVGDGLTNENANSAILDLWYSKAMRMWTSLLKKVDGAFWRDMHNIYSDVEGNAGLYPYSFFAFITEDAYHYHPIGWTNIETMNPATESLWRNPVETYDYDDRDDSAEEGDGLVRAFDNMQYKLRFELPGTRDEYFEKPTMNRQFIATSKLGMNNYKDLLRAANDRTYYKTSLSLPAVDWSGIDLVYQSDLDTVTIYDGNGAGGIGGTAGGWGTGNYKNEADATYDGARYYWVNGNYIHPIIHPSRYFHQHKVKEPTSQLDSFTQPTSLWMQNICKSRQRGGGVISPKA